MNPLSAFGTLKSIRASRAERREEVSPMAAFNADGMVFGHNGDAWLYRVLPRSPLIWGDEDIRNAHAARLATMLAEIGSRSRGPVIHGTKVGAAFREFHLLQLAWDAPCRLPQPEGTHPRLIEWTAPVLGGFEICESLFVAGVKLRRSGPAVTGPLQTVRAQIAEAVSHNPPDLHAYAADRALIGPILSRAGGRPPTLDEMRRVEGWWNGGRGSDGFLVEEDDGRLLSTTWWPEGLEFGALYGFERTRWEPEHGLWASDAFAHVDGCVALSVRGELVPSRVARTDFRRSQRKALDRMEEQEKTGDLSREEDAILLQDAALLESLFVQSPNEPLVRRCSLVFARRASAADDSYAEMLNDAWGMQVKPVEWRQHDVYLETLPCGKSSLPKTFRQDLTVDVLARSGLGASCEVGDAEGIWMGVTQPDAQPVWLDPGGSAKQNRPPSFAVVGEPGAGKTFFLQLLATQSAAAGYPTVYINPKPADSLDGFVAAAGGETIRISSDRTARGMLDPFRFAPSPGDAAEIAASHILAVLGEMGEAEEVRLQSGLRRAADAGARCVAEALRHPEVPVGAAETAMLQAEGSTLFGMGIGTEPAEPIKFTGDGRITLVEFDRALPLPATISSSHHYTRPERIAVAAVRLVAQAALEQMFAARRGVLIVDEAHVLLGSREGRQILDRAGREGRSQRILPVLATQRIADLIGDPTSSMESYTGRVLVMKMTAPEEVKASLRLVGLKETPQRAQWLAAAGPRRASGDDPGHGALALFRDLSDRRSAVMIGPVPDHVAELFSTNPLDREERERRRARPVAAGVP